MLHSICQQIWKTQQWPQDRKRCFHSNPQKPVPKNAQTTAQLYSFHILKVRLQIIQARLPQDVNREIPDVQAGFRKGRGNRDQIVNIRWIIRKAREFQKNIYFWFIDYTKAFDFVDHNKVWKILQEMRIPDPPYLPHEKPVCRSRSNSWNWTWNNGLVLNWERSTSRLYIVTLLI